MSSTADAKARRVTFETRRRIPSKPHLEPKPKLARSGSDAAEREFWLMLERITQVAVLKEPDAETVPLIADIRLLDLDAADAAVLATVVLARRRGACRTFLSRDEDFQTDAVREYMADEGLEFLTNQIVGPLRARVGKDAVEG